MNPQPKKKRYESPQYLDFVRGLPCAVCGGQSEPHHATSRGASGSDLTCIPLCRREHTEAHALGLNSFENKHDIDIQFISVKLLMTYVMQLESALYGRAG